MLSGDQSSAFKYLKAVEKLHQWLTGRCAFSYEGFSEGAGFA
jgi:hypothetical protein